MAAASGGSKNERKKQQELEEARKAGLAEPAKDEEGKEINPHIPQFMSSTPWYMNEDKPTLKHQRNWNQQSFDDQWYDRGVRTYQATKYRKGACENCGAMSHKTKDCMERPRRKGAKLTNMNIAPDEKIQHLELSYEGKRDRYNGYDPAMYAEVIDMYDRLEEKKLEKQRDEERQRLQERQRKAEQGEYVSTTAEDDAKIDDSAQQSFNKVEKRVRSAGGGATMSVRNLRIREDTAKYLLNLDTDSAYYDPKTRSMREDPTPHIDPSQKTFAGENAIRQTGETEHLAQLHKHAAEANEQGQDIHVQGMPSQAEKVYKEFQKQRQQLSKHAKSDVLDKYGNAAEEEQPPQELLFGQTEAYAEYDRSGRLVKGAEAPAPRSRYEEDVLENNHSEIFGSYFCVETGQWGYACCRSIIRNSYCTGLAGQQAARLQHEESEQAREHEEEKQKELVPREELSKDVREKVDRLTGRGQSGDAVSEDKVQPDDLTEEEMEAYRRHKVRKEDPMAGLLHG